MSKGMTKTNRERLNDLLARYRLAVNISPTDVTEMAALLVREREWFDPHIRSFYAIMRDPVVVDNADWTAAEEEIMQRQVAELKKPADRKAARRMMRARLIRQASSIIAELESLDVHTNYEHEAEER